jgi:hypothetical protein
MTLAKRCRIVWAALTQDWRDFTCRCGLVGYTSAAFSVDPELCSDCEARRYEQWWKSHHVTL